MPFFQRSQTKRSHADQEEPEDQDFKEVLACLEIIKTEADKCKTQWVQSRTTSQLIQELPEDSREKLESGRSFLRDKLKIFGEELRILREEVNALFGEEELHQEMPDDQDEGPEGQKPEPKDSHYVLLRRASSKVKTILTSMK